MNLFEKTFEIPARNVLFTLFVSLFTFNLLYLYTKLNQLQASTLELQTKINKLLSENLELTNNVNKLLAENLELRTKLSEMLKDNKAFQLSLDNFNNTNPMLDPSFISAQHDMTQFYIKTFLGVAAVIIVGALIFNLSPFSSIFNLKKVLPTTLYTFVQDRTPFLQTKVSYSHLEPSNNSDWLVTIINDRHVSLAVKPQYGSDYLSLSDFLNQHMHAGQALIRFTDTASQTSEQLTQVATQAATHANVAIAANPSTLEIASQLTNLI